MSYYPSDNQVIACIQSFLPGISVDIIKKCGSYDVVTLYENVISGKYHLVSSDTYDKYVETVIVMGLIGCSYGFWSLEFKNVKQNIYKYSNIDLGWLIDLFYIIFHHKPYYVPYTNMSDSVYSLPENVTILLAGDIGTGLASEEQVLINATKQYNIDYFIHIGDVYYSGAIHEYEKNFLNVCDKYLPSQCRMLTVAGNHDYYSGGGGYLWCLDKIQQRSSYFCLTNEYVQIQAMDTAYCSANSVPILCDAEVKWQKDKLDRASSQKIIMLSHHQFISYNKSIVTATIGSYPYCINENLFEQYEGYISKPSAWFWGHDHFFMLYQDYKSSSDETLKKPRLIGHGSCPEQNSALDQIYTPPNSSTFSDKYPIPKLIEPTNWQLGNNGEVINNGYVILKINRNIITAEYYEIVSPKVGSFLPAKMTFSESI